jgi:hypothetical protein
VAVRVFSKAGEIIDFFEFGTPANSVKGSLDTESAAEGVWKYLISMRVFLGAHQQEWTLAA